MSKFRPIFKLMLMFEHVGDLIYLLMFPVLFNLSVEVKCSQEEVQKNEREARVAA